jgi:uncharacterized protein with HEPN domain
MLIPRWDWPGIARFRNVVVHDYLGIDLARIWDIVQHDLPGLKRSVEAMLAESDDRMAQRSAGKGTIR